MVDASTRRTVPRPRDHRVDRQLFALEDGLHAAVRKVPDPAPDAEIAGVLGASGAEEDTLDATGEHEADARDHRLDTRTMTRYDGRTALLVVDVQNDFADPGGSLAVRGGHDVVEPLNREIEAAREARALVVYTLDWHPEHTPHFQQDGGIWPVHCVAGSWGAQLHPTLDVVEGETLHKGDDGRDGYSAFSVRDPLGGATEPTRLQRALRERDIERLVIGGLATDYCVVETVLDGRRLGYDVAVLTSAVRAVDLAPGDGDRALERIRDAGATLV